MILYARTDDCLGVNHDGSKERTQTVNCKTQIATFARYVVVVCYNMSLASKVRSGLLLVFRNLTRSRDIVTPAGISGLRAETQIRAPQRNAIYNEKTTEQEYYW
jgi:hypothetical protein